MALVDPGFNRGIWKARGNTPVAHVQLAEDCEVGDVLGFHDGYKRALATSGSVIQGKYVALEMGLEGEEIEVSKNAVVVGYTGGTPGALIYVAEGTDYGKIIDTRPTDSGDAGTVIGVMVSTTVAIFFLGGRSESLVT